MYDLTETLLDAWSTIRPRLDADPDLLRQRLARRSQAQLDRPLREWSIALRANDRRLTLEHVRIEPHYTDAQRRLPHRMVITRDLLCELCRPFRPDFPRTQLKIFAQRLGVLPHRIREAIKRGQGRLHRIRGFQHKNCPHGGIPFVEGLDSKIPFNSCADKLQPPEPVWGHFWESLVDLLPDNFEQTLLRVPAFNREGSAHPNVTPALLEISRDPAALAPDLPEGQLPRFWGWRWRCPACEQTCRTIFLPIRPLVHLDFRDYLEAHIPEEPAELHSSFACAKCHKLRPQVSWANPDAWNYVVAVITGGLLYGHEVKIPAWLKRDRKRGPRRSPVLPHPKRDAVAQRLADGLTYNQIARDLQISPTTVAGHVAALKKYHKTPTRAQLLTLLQSKTKKPSARAG